MASTRCDTLFNDLLVAFVAYVKQHAIPDALKADLKASYRSIDKHSSQYVDTFITENAGLLSALPECNPLDLRVCANISVARLFAEVPNLDRDACMRHARMLTGVAYAKHMLCTTGVDMLDSCVAGLLTNCPGEDADTGVKTIAAWTVPQSAPPQEQPVNLDALLPERVRSSKLYQLAQDVASNIDARDLPAVDSPGELLQALLTGQGDALGSVVAKVSGTIHKQMEAGALKQGDLMEEVTGLLGALAPQLMGGAGGGLLGMMQNPGGNEGGAPVMDLLRGLAGQFAGHLGDAPLAGPSEHKPRLKRRAQGKRKL
jgi:hypothetical protein